MNYKSINPDSGLTSEESLAMDFLKEFYHAYKKLPIQHTDELQEAVAHIHALQSLLALRIVRRDYPDEWPTYKIT